jgi:putative phage-type endonuclease
MKIINCEQQSEEWFNCRKLKMTSSKAQAIANNGTGLQSYIYELVAEYYSSSEKEHFSNEHTERGNELEPTARDMYELETGNKVEQVGFIEMNKYSGGSPDGLVGDDGLIEIKCVEDKKYFKLLVDKEEITDYDWQIQMNLLVSGRKWCDLVIYNPNFEKNMIIQRKYIDELKQEKLKVGLAQGEKMIKDLINKYKKI